MLCISERTGDCLEFHLPRTQTSRVHNDALRGLLVVQTADGWRVKRPKPDGGSYPYPGLKPFGSEQLAEARARLILGV